MTDPDHGRAKVHREHRAPDAGQHRITGTDLTRAEDRSSNDNRHGMAAFDVFCSTDAERVCGPSALARQDGRPLPTRRASAVLTVSGVDER